MPMTSYSMYLAERRIGGVVWVGGGVGWCGVVVLVGWDGGCGFGA